MNGAQSLVHTLLQGRVDVCFANPGTSEMHFVAALDTLPGMRCVLGLFEGVVTGAADGYYRMADRPAATLLHLGPGLANGLANLHNAKKARSGIVNIVGDHATTHLALDAPLTSDIAGLAAPMSHWVRSSPSAAHIAADGREAIHQANARPGRIATLILPADTAWSEVGQGGSPGSSSATESLQTNDASSASALTASPTLDTRTIGHAAQALRRGGSTLLLLGGHALRGEAAALAGRLAAATGCALKSEFYSARIERGAGRVLLPRLPYAVEPSLAALAPFDRIVLIGAKRPVAFFAYPGKPGVLSRPDCECITVSTPEHDPIEALRALLDAVGGDNVKAVSAMPVAERARVALPSGALDPLGIARVVAAVLPDDAIVVDEAVTTGRNFDATTADAAPHDWLTGCGGSIGFALPVAVGAAIAAPGRRVLALEGDGSGMYTLQALWTMVRESLNITVVIFANRAYSILRGEFAGVGAGTGGVMGQRAQDMLTLDRPDLDWVALAKGMGMAGTRVSDLEGLGRALQRGLAADGPSLIEVVL